MVDFNLSSAALAGEAIFEAAIMVFVFVLVLFAGSMVLPGRTGSGRILKVNSRFINSTVSPCS